VRPFSAAVASACALNGSQAGAPGSASPERVFEGEKSQELTEAGKFSLGVNRYAMCGESRRIGQRQGETLAICPAGAPDAFQYCGMANEDDARRCAYCDSRLPGCFRPRTFGVRVAITTAAPPLIYNLLGM